MRKEMFMYCPIVREIGGRESSGAQPCSLLFEWRELRSRRGGGGLYQTERALKY
jgi:hypothetical protein